MALSPGELKGCVSEEIHPLKSLQELLEWKEPEKGASWKKPLKPRVSPSSHPRTLICHDMKGGYLDDRFVGGCSNKDAYRFYHWSGVDTFVYFSHHLVTIPPPVWIDAAHLHGVTVLGTFITEWEAGSAVCNELLASEETVARAVNQLTHIALYYGFEGWLINIENEIPEAKIPLLLQFVRELTASMKTANTERIEGKIREKSKEIEKNCKSETNTEKRKINTSSEGRHDSHYVIWYDSVTENGKLDWQNELNSLNQAFFSACDGIFLNYTWTEAHLERTKEAATVDGCEGGRLHDVFVGLDVFGRNFFEGGKYNTWKALELVRKYGLSAAIFAPGWTYETQDNFVEAEKLMWRSLTPFLNHHGPNHLPLRTSFCQGYGEHFYCKGKVEREGSWHNLGLQQLQPQWSQEDKQNTCLSLVTQDAYSGGGCLSITTFSCATVRLLVCDLHWQGTLRLSVAYKWCGTPSTFTLLCCLAKTHGASYSSSQSRILEFTCKENNGELDNEEKKECTNEDPVTECQLVDSYVENGWNIRIFTAQEVPGYKMSTVNLRVEGAADLRLGELSIVNVT